MQSEIADKLPFGWYLKEADTLITQNINNTFETYGINRFHWQVLKNIDTHGKICKDLFYHQVSRFLTRTELDEIMEMLEYRKWINEDQGNYSFTDLGAQEYKQISVIQEENKQKILAGTTPEAYLATINFLETVIKNLGGKV
ncbi:hypothetical protein ACDQ55_13480 [Chitinophaga sp. 30R24]|uniref:hypothetical protein n=1 Tax=Chitinophaga sp. 30R24 TaxID=3248838 RepID=UPI003B8F09D7